MRLLAIGLVLALPVAGGGGLLALTSLDWSPDGRYVLYVDGGELWIGLAPEGRSPRPLTQGAGTDWARFGPGGWFVYVTPSPEGYTLWKAVPDGERYPLLTLADLRNAGIPAETLARPAVSPDGEKIAFVAHAEGSCDLYLLELGSRAIRRLTRAPGPVDCPAFAPDGRSLVFVALWPIGKSLSWDLYLLDLEGDLIERLTEDPFFDWCPRFSPDGEWIAFESNARGPSDIHIVRRDGRERTALTFDEWRDAFPAWSPKGDEVAYGSLRSRGWFILASKTS